MPRGFGRNPGNRPQHHLCVIEDACEAIGAEFDGRKAGGWGDAGVFAFYPNKQITTAKAEW